MHWPVIMMKKLGFRLSFFLTFLAESSFVNLLTRLHVRFNICNHRVNPRPSGTFLQIIATTSLSLNFDGLSERGRLCLYTDCL